jgi:outer membrane biogenesis lipoprotein LolB
LGLGRTHLQGGEDNLTLTASQQPVVSGPAAQIMQTHLGWSLPLAALGSWLNGQPAEALPTKAKDIDTSGRLMRLEQAQFSVTFADHTPVASGWRPQRVAISGQGLMLEVTIRIPQPVMSETSLTPKDSIRTIARSKIVATNPRLSPKV